MIGDRLRELREGAGLDGPRMAAIAGTTKQYVGQLENGTNKSPNALLLLKWARHFEVSLDWLIAGEGPREVRPSASRAASQSVSITPDIVLAAVAHARKAIGLTSGDKLNVEKEPEVFAQALRVALAAAQKPDAEADHGSTPRTGANGRSGRASSEAKAGAASQPARRRARKSA